VPSQAPVEPQGRAIAQDIMEKLTELRMRCQRYTGSVVTPMGDEMFYRYQESLIDEMAATLAAAVALKFGPISEAAPRPIGGS
jgi:hypothetical protein